MNWDWQGFSIRYQTVGTSGAPVLCIHGFGASSDHWRKNLPVWGRDHRAYAIDLLGFGQSAKPTPKEQADYTFEAWGQQIIDFCRDVIGDEPVFLVGNSIGCVAAMQAATMAPELVRSIVMLDCSLRMLHERRWQWHQQLTVPWFQKALSYRPFGHFFFSRVARRPIIRQLLQQAYARQEAVTDELVDILWQPSQEAGAADVFLSFVCNSQGPLPEDLLAHLPCPTLMVWGQDDPWEPVALGRELLAGYPAVEGFIALEGVGHCPQDEAPELINPLVGDWVARQGG